MLPSKRLHVLLGMLALCSGAVACDATGAFGVKFGTPVPAAASSVKDLYFQGGTRLASFSAPAPAPLPGFDNHVYWSAPDRKAVYAVVAYKRLISDQKLLWDDDHRTAVLEKTKLEIRELAKSWEQAYGLAFRAESPKELTWKAESSDVRSRIGTFGGEFLYVECEHKQLQQAAWDKGAQH